MVKKEMVTRTIESFIRQLKKDGHDKYASELRTIVAMSRNRKEALSALSNMTITLLEHIIKYVTMPQSLNRDKWRREIRGYLNRFNIRNKSPKSQPWLTIEYIQADLNDVLSSASFLIDMKEVLSEYSDTEAENATNLLKTHKTLKSLGIKLFYDEDSNLIVDIGGQPL